MPEESRLGMGLWPRRKLTVGHPFFFELTDSLHTKSWQRSFTPLIHCPLLSGSIRIWNPHFFLLFIMMVRSVTSRLRATGRCVWARRSRFACGGRSRPRLNDCSYAHAGMARNSLSKGCDGNFYRSNPHSPKPISSTVSPASRNSDLAIGKSLIAILLNHSYDCWVGLKKPSHAVCRSPCFDVASE